ncbi:hypothetical protein BF17_10765 [Yersinia similis]|uniref:PH domain-containing protein n=2 Tax=Yersinia TaxID=629 RepID=A0ABN4CTI8_9GAMM|nr:hypothetical protein BF17_10765 [Yersinia similis]CFQ65499.1 Uncharacterised protein [Yersinia similis]CNB70940.1 Uncharacterised protein [Yersinia similis]CNE28978.1 Uncharacterised protein [Yersinia similis]
MQPIIYNQSDLYRMNNNEKFSVIIGTRVGQWLALTSVLLPFIFMFVYMEYDKYSNHAFWESAVIIAIACFALPFLLFITLFRGKRNMMTIKKNALVFDKHAEIPFDTISTYNFAGLLKLKRAGRLTMFIRARGDNLVIFHAFRDAFIIAMSNWVNEKSIKSDHALPQRTYFYGAWPARVAGVLVMFLNLPFLFFCITRYAELPTGMFIYIIISMIIISLIGFFLWTSDRSIG